MPALFFVVAIGLLGVYARQWLDVAPAAGPTREATALPPGRLSVSADGRYLTRPDGAPFFWLGDTAWELFHRLNRDEAEQYLEDRRQKGFTVILAVALASLDGFNSPNAYGARALVDGDPAQPALTPGDDPDDPAAYDYWDHVDFVVDAAAAKGLYVAILPSWADRVLPGKSGRAVFDADRARTFGRFLGERYGNRSNVIWMLGGDQPAVVNGTSYVDLWRAMAAGVQDGAGSGQVMTYHPSGQASSGQWFQSDGWLSFNMLQSGHLRRDLPVWDQVARDYARTPVKPTVDGEPNYEDHPIGWKPEQGYFRDDDVRKQSYRSLFAGAFGVTYGNNSVWQMFAPGRAPWTSPERYWYEALDRPGAVQMSHLRALVESRPMLSRVPDQGLLASPAENGARHVQATRATDGAYAFVYVPTAGQAVTVEMGKLSGGTARAWWFDPRTGASQAIGTFPTSGAHAFTTPADGPDWVLVLDDASKAFPAPGQTSSNAR